MSPSSLSTVSVAWSGVPGVVTDDHDGDDVGAQAEYDGGPELRELLTRAAASPTVHGVNDGRDGDDAHLQRVHDSPQPPLHEHAKLIQRLREDACGDADDDVHPV